MVGALYRVRMLGCALALCAAAPPALAACPAANRYSFLFNSQAAATFNYANTYTYTASTAWGRRSISPRAS
ncbi:MAG: hypothetical protein H0X36_08660 [Sphingomonadaceae bacterium]|nr:hypothetical protein [Sphingomonadaceae bacterium]